VNWLAHADWRAVFVPDTALLEIVVRGTITYIALFVLLRFVLRRQSGAMGVTDLLVIVLIADAAQNAMAGSYQSLSDGILLVTVIVGWAVVLDWLSFRSPRVERLLKPPKLQLVSDGRPQRRNMAREFITMDELMMALREDGIESLSDVKAAYMESDGRISAIPYDESGRRPKTPEPKQT
jgi:uncharacterized membrane protein YcaP (DUF421 family)